MLTTSAKGREGDLRGPWLDHVGREPEEAAAASVD
jgi:hypothetical protein